VRRSPDRGVAWAGLALSAIALLGLATLLVINALT
jgi:hypothetical protein